MFVVWFLKRAWAACDPYTSVELVACCLNKKRGVIGPQIPWDNILAPKNGVITLEVIYTNNTLKTIITLSANHTPSPTQWDLDPLSSVCLLRKRWCLYLWREFLFVIKTNTSWFSVCLFQVPTFFVIKTCWSPIVLGMSPIMPVTTVKITQPQKSGQRMSLIGCGIHFSTANQTLRRIHSQRANLVSRVLSH